MKRRIYFITLSLMILLVICAAIYAYIGPSYSIVNDTYVKYVNKKNTSNYYEKEFEVSINNKKHIVKIVGEQIEKNNITSTDYVVECKLFFDSKDIRTMSYTNHGIELSNLDEFYDLNEEDFYFIKGVDEKNYLAIRFGTSLTILNDNGKILTHKPFMEEKDYFTYAINIDEEYDYIIEPNYKDENGNDMVETYFYKNELFSKVSNKVTQINNGYVSTKIENNKIYSFIIAPDLPGFNYIEEIILYENEYVISNDEIYYKQLNKYNMSVSN